MSIVCLNLLNGQMTNLWVLGNKTTMLCTFAASWLQAVRLGLGLGFLALFLMVRVRFKVRVRAIVTWHARVFCKKSHSFASFHYAI